MTAQALSPDVLLTTTRAVRKRLDLSRPVPMALIEECLQIALQAPSGGNSQGWHFVVVMDAAKRKALAEIYRRSWAVYVNEPFAAGNLQFSDAVRAAQQQRVMDSASYLAEHLHEVPVHVIPCLSGRPAPDAPLPPMTRGGSIYPAAWSYMLAARARGLGTCLTSLHVRYEREAADLLGIPYDSVWQAGLITTGFYRGEDFAPARREPLASVLHVDGW